MTLLACALAFVAKVCGELLSIIRGDPGGFDFVPDSEKAAETALSVDAEILIAECEQYLLIT